MGPFRLSVLFLFILAGVARALPNGNGGFESGLLGWSYAVKAGEAATVGTVIERNHTGGNSLQIAINGSGNRDSIVKLSTAPMELDTGRIYMLRFWALTKTRAAGVDLRIGSGAAFRKCHYEIWDGDGPWHRYQLLFKPAARDNAITLSFGTATTYWIDDVELFDETDTLLDIRTQYMWQSSHVGYGWIAGDNDVSVPLPDGRNAWILNDSFMGMVNAENNVLKDVRMINNLIVVQDKKAPPTLSAVYNGVAGDPKGLFPPTAYTLYWIADGFVAGNTLQVLLQEWNVAFNFNNAAMAATLSLPDLKVLSMTRTAYKSRDIPNAALAEDKYTYVYAAQRISAQDRNTRIARIPGGALDPKATWEWLASDRTWTTDTGKAAVMIKGVEIASAAKLGDSNYVFAGVRNLSDLSVWFAKTPIGPWTEPITVYKAPQEAGIVPYLGHIHKGLAKDGIYTLSYSLFPSTGGWFQQLSDRGCYLPQYVKANLLKLSPYTKAKPTALKPRRAGGRGAYPARAAGRSLTGRRLPQRS